MEIAENSIHDRRAFLETGLKLSAITGMAGMGFLSSCKKEEEEENKKISPTEDLMQEHGILNRILLIYDTCKTQLANKRIFQTEILLESATIIRNFVENYHEKQEENYLFPRFEKANQLN